MADDILKTLIAEAYGEGPEGMRLVAETILNRAAIRGLTPEQVVRQSKQYTGLNSPGPEAKKAWNSPEAIAAAQAAWELAQQPGDPTGGADHYYAPDTISQPYWAKSMTPTVEAGGHKFFASRPIPPGEIPNTVGTALSTLPTPDRPPVPVTPSIDLAQYRKNVAPSQLGPETFAQLSKPKRNVADEIAMSPIMGGKQEQPMFDAAYDTRVGAMRPTNYPVQGSQVGASKAPAPVPRLPSPQLAAQRATDPTLQAALNARYPAQLPALPPPVTPPKATTIATYSTKPHVKGMSYAGQEGGAWPQAFPTTAQITAATGFRPPPAIPDRLPQGVAGMPALYGTGNVAGVGTQAVAPMPFNRPAASAPTQVAQGKVAPVPFQRPTAVGTELATQPMPPLPIPRPPLGMGGAEMPAPVPAQMSPLMALQRAVPRLRPPSSPAAQKAWMAGFSNSESSGGAHGGSDKDKHPGVSYNIGRNY